MRLAQKAPNTFDALVDPLVYNTIASSEGVKLQESTATASPMSPIEPTSTIIAVFTPPTSSQSVLVAL